MACTNLCYLSRGPPAVGGREGKASQPPRCPPTPGEMNWILLWLFASGASADLTLRDWGGGERTPPSPAQGAEETMEKK